MEIPRFATRDELIRLRGEREFAWQGDGLWVSGPLDALVRPCVAIVGTRAATPYGRRLAHTFARTLAQAGCTIVSGLALGIDAAAHEGALDVPNGLSIGVLGSGHARFFPRRNAALAERLRTGGGAVLSPYAPGCEARPWQFLVRNAVVAALADAVVVIEAPARSGALNTAGWAAGRIPVFVTPGDLDRASFAGSHALIRDGATLACEANDVLEALQMLARPATVPAIVRDGLAGALLDLLAHGETTLDELVAATATRAADVLAALALLELEGVIERRGADRFARLLH